MVLRSEKFEVREVPVVTRDGATVTKHVVVHPGAVALLPVLDDGRVVLIRNTRFAVGRTLWEVAAGTLEIGEEPMACAARELREETGYEAATLEPLVQFYSAPGFCTELLHVFVATGLRRVRIPNGPVHRRNLQRTFHRLGDQGRIVVSVLTIAGG